MSTRANTETRLETESLEAQLEQIFSDYRLSDAPAPTPGQPARRAVRDQRATAPAFSPETAVPTVDHEPQPRGEVRSRWLTGSLGMLAVVLLVSSFMLFKPEKAAESGAALQPSSQSAQIDARQAEHTTAATPSASTRIAQEALADDLAMTTATPPAPGLEIQNQGTIETFTADTTLPNTPPTAPATPAPATSTPVVPTPTETATAVPPTPTLPPAEPVVPATTTPKPASSLGLAAIPTPVPRIALPDNAINIVLLGSDQRPYESWWRTDVVIVVSVNPDMPSVSMLSIPRDTWLYIPNWTYQRMNMADTHGISVGYPGSGPGLVKATIEYNFGVHVDYFARVNFSGLINIVDALGGIDVILDCPVEDGFPDDPITEDPSVVTQISYPVPGVYHLDGKHALWLARSRKTTSEFARSRRQHRILQGIWAKANQMGFISQLPELWEQLTNTVQTDLSLEDVLWLASVGLRLEPSQIQSGFLDGRHLTAWVSPGGANVLLPHTEAILETLGPLFDPYPYKAPQGFNRVEVWNGSGQEHWGTLAADRLWRNGFDVVEIQDIEELYSESLILDFTSSSKGSPLPLLQQITQAEVSHVSLEPGAEAQTRPPFRLIVGSDYQPCERPKAAQWGPTPTPSGPTGN